MTFYQKSLSFIENENGNYGVRYSVKSACKILKVIENNGQKLQIQGKYSN